MELITASMNRYVADVQARLRELGRPVIAEMFRQTYLNTIETTVRFDENGAFVITGDIPAMWLRDSSAQVRHYLGLTAEDADIRSLVAGLIKRQAYCILTDPYANAFNQTKKEGGHYADTTEFDDPMAWERKYEVDSLCYPVNLAYHFMKASGSVEHLDETFKSACERILDTFELEQYHAERSKYRFTRTNCPPSDTLKCDGRGTPVAYTGMTWSGFRPSDDACEYHYLIPSEMFAVVILGYMAEFAGDVWHDEAMRARALRLRGEIDEGIHRFGTTEHPEFGTIYVYETDGLGNFNLMDDANVPSLLSLPYLGYCSTDDPIYQNTRRFILSKGNPYYYEGTAARGIGSPHTPKNYIWHVSLAMQGLTSVCDEEVDALLDLFETTTAGTGLMHEGFHVDDPERFTRSWFAWANSIFAEFVIHTVEHRSK